MTLFDAMGMIFSFFSTPAFFYVLGSILSVGAVWRVIFELDVDEFYWWTLLWAIPAVFLGISLILWAGSSTEPFEWVSRR